MQKPFIVGITGGSASGKTLFLKRLLESFEEDEICLISQDNYYRPIHHQHKDKNGIENFDIPQSIDHELYAKHILALSKGEVVEQKEYVFNNVHVTPKTLVFKPAPIIVVEGIFVFYFPDVSTLLDLKVFIDAKDKVKLQRRIKRDNEERGYDLTDVMYRWENHVTPTYNQFIRPYKKIADVVIPNNVNFERGLGVLVGFLKGLLKE